jgi:hypothetical protein
MDTLFDKLLNLPGIVAVSIIILIFTCSTTVIYFIHLYTLVDPTILSWTLISTGSLIIVLKHFYFTKRTKD